jgi:hypothetical protein
MFSSLMACSLQRSSRAAPVPGHHCFVDEKSRQATSRGRPPRSPQLTARPLGKRHEAASLLPFGHQMKQKAVREPLRSERKLHGSFCNERPLSIDVG